MRLTRGCGGGAGAGRIGGGDQVNQATEAKIAIGITSVLRRYYVGTVCHDSHGKHRAR
ncbi:hypothetical protein [Shimia sp. W99]